MVFSERRIQTAFGEAVAFFQSRRIKYMVVGALAVAVWGRTRATADLDFQIQLPAFDPFLQRVPRAWIADTQWDLHNPLLRQQHRRMLVHGIAVDLMLPRDEFELTMFSHRVRRKLWGRMVSLVSAADLVLMKMKAARPHDFDDAASVIELQPSLNRAYIHRWALKLGLHQEYKYLFRN